MALIGDGRRWGLVARYLHWGMAALLLAQGVLGLLAVSWRLSPTKLELFVWHKSLGIALLVLVALRLGWRLLERRPAPPADGSVGERRLAATAHAGLYALLFAIPLSGWLIQSASGFPFKVFGWLPLPPLAGRDKALQSLAETLHLGLLIAFGLLLLLHIGAALYHHFGRRDDVLRGMWLTGPSAGGRGR